MGQWEPKEGLISSPTNVSDNGRGSVEEVMLNVS